MNIKILGLPLAIVSCLSLNIASYAATNHQLTSSNARTSSVDIDNLSQRLDLVPRSVAANSAATKSNSHNISFAAATGEQERIRLVEKTKDAVVKIIDTDGTGSGFIISKDGLVITNKHVVTDSKSRIVAKVTVVLVDGTEIEANVLGVARHQDLALIQIPNQSRLKFLKLAKPETINVGQNVYAIGSPLGIENVFTAGVLNKIDKSDDNLYHDARIASGNSGGPLINSNGEVIGVNYAGVSRSGGPSISLAIKIERVYEILADYRGKRSNFVSVTKANQGTEVTELPTTGEAIAASFKVGDETDNRNIYYRNYYFQGKANQQVTIEMSSQQIDPALVLYFIDKDNQQQELSINKGVSPQDNTAKISGILPEDGTYVVVAKTFQPGETGNYQIKVTIGQ